MKPRMFQRLRQLIRAQQRHATRVTKQTDRSIERHVFGKLDKFSKVRRFVIGWALLFALLIIVVFAQNYALSGYYQTLRPVAGGIYREGIAGSFTNANPIYATNDVDSAVSRLIFAGLFSYDAKNHLVGDLAQSWNVDKTGRVYTVKLRPRLTWQDGKPLTSADVVYTYEAIQNPDAESPLRPNWTGVQVAATDARTITFTLPNPLSSFIFNLTNGIIPEHILRDVPMSGLRSTAFNTQSPIGAGPFEWHDIQISGHSPSDAQATIGLLPFENYWAGEPKLRTFTVHAFAKSQDMIDAYKANQLNAMAGLQQMPDGMDGQTLKNSRSFVVTAANMVFFRTTSPVFKDVVTRRALVLAAQPQKIMAQLGYYTPRVKEPLLASQFAYDSKYAQVTGDPTKAAQHLDKAGWYVGKDGVRAKNKLRLSFKLVAANTREQRMVTEQLKRQWDQLGVNVQVALLDNDSFHTALINHDYDALVYGITIGADPDVFVYWDSSQNDIRAANRLNLSEYSSDAADVALEAGRTRTGEALRRAKYAAFLKAWQGDAPALGLYQPRFLYVSRTTIYGLKRMIINTPTERYDNVANWMIRTAKVTNP